MSSELTIDYTLSYKVSVDVDKARLGDLDYLWEEADEEEEQFLEFVKDTVMASLEQFEVMKLRGDVMPEWLTHFSLNEHLDSGVNDD